MGNDLSSPDTAQALLNIARAIDSGAIGGPQTRAPRPRDGAIDSGAIDMGAPRGRGDRTDDKIEQAAKIAHDFGQRIAKLDDAEGSEGASAGAMFGEEGAAALAKLKSKLQEVLVEARRGAKPKWGRVVAAAIEGLHKSAAHKACSVKARAVGQRLTALRWFIADFMKGECGIDKPLAIPASWSFPPSDSAARTAAFYNEVELLRCFHSLGADLKQTCGTAVASPVVAAYHNGNTEAFDVVMELGAVMPQDKFAHDRNGVTCSEPDFQMSVALALTAAMGHEDKISNKAPTPALLEARLAMYTRCLDRDLSAVNARTYRRANGKVMAETLLGTAFDVGSAPLVRTLLERGFKPITTTEAVVTVSGSRTKIPTTVSAAAGLAFAPHEVYRAFVEGADAFKDWQTRFDEKAQDQLVQIMISAVRQVASGASSNPNVSASDLEANIRLTLERGFNRTWESKTAEGLHLNLLLDGLLTYTVLGAPDRPYREATVLRLIKLFHEHGANVNDTDVGSKKDNRLHLVHLGAMRDYTSVVDFALETVGSPADVNKACAINAHRNDPSAMTLTSALTLATNAKNTSLAMHLLRKYHAKAALPGLVWVSQPISPLLAPQYSDAEALPLVKQMLSDPANNGDALFEPSYYPPSTVMRYCLNPIANAVIHRKPACLEALLTSGASGFTKIQQCVDQPGLYRLAQWDQVVHYGTPIQLAVELEAWDCALLLLKHSTPRVTASYSYPAAKTPADVRLMPSTSAILKRARTTDRRVVTAMQLAEAKEAAAGPAPSLLPSMVGVATNAPEFPPVKVLSAKEQKKRDKKRANKKKAKAKKREAEAALAGAGGVAAAEEDSSSSDDDDEEGLNEDERNFGSGPSFEALKAEAELRAAAEAAAGAGAPERQ